MTETVMHELPLVEESEMFSRKKERPLLGLTVFFAHHTHRP